VYVRARYGVMDWGQNSSTARLSPSTGTSDGIDETELQRRAEARRGRRLVNGLGLISGPRVIVVAS
jgi:hypothetical protein